jgi:FkbM family methyltransferase
VKIAVDHLNYKKSQKMRINRNMIKRNLKLLTDVIHDLQSVLLFIYKHPLSKKHRVRGFTSFLRWQISQFLSPRLVVKAWVSGLKIVVKKGMTGITGSIYVGLHEFEDMGFVLHYLDEKSYFLDIGANVGCYSLLAASKGADVLSFEPDKDSVSALNVNKCINNFDNITVINKAVGNECGEVKFTEQLDTVNYVLDSSSSGGIIVSMVNVDSIVLDERPIVMKIDVEGYEANVLDGAEKHLKNNVTVVIVETNNSNLSYGSSNSDIFTKLKRLGFQPFTYDPFSRILSEVGPERIGNTIFLKDPVSASKRLLKADSFCTMSELI